MFTVPERKELRVIDVSNVQVMEESLLNRHVIVVIKLIDQLGQIILNVLRAMATVDKHLMNFAMIVSDVVINKRNQLS